MTWLDDYETRRKAEAAASRTACFAALRAANISRVTIEYDGNGDSGDITEITYSPPTTDPALDELVTSYIYDALPGGWEINEGSYGIATIHVAAGWADFDHNDRIESSVHNPFEDHHDKGGI